MSVNRRDFIRSFAAGSAVAVLGCGQSVAGATDDAGCPLPPTTPTSVPDLPYPTAAYFQQVASDLAAAGLGTPQVLIDMDRLDANIAEIVSKAQPGRFRIVEKSLPSLDLLSYVQQKSGSQKFLVLHLPFLPGVLSTFPNADVLVGKSHLKEAIGSFFATQPKANWATIAKQVTFIADNLDRLQSLAGLANDLQVTLKLAIEIDVGLRRSGLTDPALLGPMLDFFESNASLVQFAGFLGYDGHVAFAPGGTLAAVQDAWTAATAVYQSYVDGLKSHPGLVTPDLVFNSGGSSTYPMYTSGPVNDVAAGGGVLRPGDYPNYVIGALQPAIFIATPVFTVYPQPQLPFFTPAQCATLFKGQQGLTIYGGGWPAFYTYPPGIQPAPFVSDLTDPAMVPNQGMVMAPAATPINPGDWIFYHPRQSDALFQFDQILQVRGGRLQTTTMAAYPRRY
ncbi:MAG TPA: alanine racemase [Polyangiaceae bacterium]|nr:alanine racemase [Polyangiaceae bacterium]